MKDRTKLSASYRGIPCWYNQFTEDICGKNWIYDKLVDIMIWIDLNILNVEESPLWVEDTNENQ